MHDQLSCSVRAYPHTHTAGLPAVLVLFQTFPGLGNATPLQNENQLTVFSIDPPSSLLLIKRVDLVTEKLKRSVGSNAAVRIEYLVRNVRVANHYPRLHTHLDLEDRT